MPISRRGVQLGGEPLKRSTKLVRVPDRERPAERGKHAGGGVEVVGSGSKQHPTLGLLRSPIVLGIRRLAAHARVWIHQADAAVAKGAKPEKNDGKITSYLLRPEFYRSAFSLTRRGARGSSP